jgi:hypothetical protein
LSYPSSHLVPYLRTKKYPREVYPELYQYREPLPRLEAKLRRVYKRIPVGLAANPGLVLQTKIQDLKLEKKVDAIITSPPYMNALDYGRDNRLRLWLLSGQAEITSRDPFSPKGEEFTDVIRHLVRIATMNLKPDGYCVVIVGQANPNSRSGHPAAIVRQQFQNFCSSLKLVDAISDAIPDIRRSRKEFFGVKSEEFLVFQKSCLPVS